MDANTAKIMVNAAAKGDTMAMARLLHAIIDGDFAPAPPPLQIPEEAIAQLTIAVHRTLGEMQAKIDAMAATHAPQAQAADTIMAAQALEAVRDRLKAISPLPPKTTVKDVADHSSAILSALVNG